MPFTKEPIQQLFKQLQNPDAEFTTRDSVTDFFVELLIRRIFIKNAEFETREALIAAIYTEKALIKSSAAETVSLGLSSPFIVESSKDVIPEACVAPDGVPTFDAKRFDGYVKELVDAINVRQCT